MAIAYLRVSTIGAKQGSIVKAAAYRSGENLHRDKTGEVANYNRKQGIGHTEIMTPPDFPDWTKKRQSLYNRIELNEKRKDARYGREIVVALPHELTVQQNIELVREYINKNVLPHGMMADFAIHLPEKKNRKYNRTREGEKFIDNKNIHCHILLTDRPIVNGDWAAKKNSQWNSKKLVEDWRSGWQDCVNRKLADCGIDARIDMRSYERQGSNIEPQKHEGKLATALRRQDGFDKEAFSQINSVIEYNDLVKQINKLTLELEAAEEQDDQPDKQPAEGSQTRQQQPQQTKFELDTWENWINDPEPDPPDFEHDSQAFEHPPNTLDRIKQPLKIRSDRGAAEQKITTANTTPNIWGDSLEMEALAEAFKTQAKYRDINNRTPKTAVDEYRLKLAEITAKFKPERVAKNFRDGSPSAMDFERLIRDYLRKRGYNRQQIIRAMRTASPALYKKSKTHAVRYARRFNEYLAKTKRKMEQQNRQRKQQKLAREQAKNRERNQRR